MSQIRWELFLEGSLKVGRCIWTLSSRYLNFSIREYNDLPRKQVLAKLTEDPKQVMFLGV